MRFAIFPLHLCKVQRLPRKSGARSYEVLHLPRKIILANLKIWYSIMQVPWPPNISDEHVSCTPHATQKCIFADLLHMSHACQCFWICYKTLTFCSLLTRCKIPCACHAKPHLNVQKWSEHVVLLTFWLGNVLHATTACAFSTSQFLKALRSWAAFTLLTSTCASRHNGVHFFDIATSTSAPKLRCFVHFDFQMCFAPQRRAIFHLSSGQMALHSPILRAYKSLEKNTVNCHFSTCIFYLLTLSQSFSVFLTLSHSFSLFLTLSQSFSLFLTLSHSFSLFLTLSHSFSSLLFSSLLWLFPPLLFHPSMLSEVWNLNFLRWSPCWKMGGSLDRTRPFVVPLGAFSTLREFA